ncbi:MAG: lysylphosphatidylglycerol synthase domain-containing protein [Bacteroidales bacterium]
MKNYIQHLHNKPYAKFLWFVLKLLITAGAWWYLYITIVSSTEGIEFQPIAGDEIIYFVLLFVLLFVNWGLEAYKWRVLVSVFQKISFLRALKGTLMGLAIGFITPSRIGDIGGRAVVLKYGRKKAIVATSVGGLVQLCVTVLFGIIGLGLFSLFFVHTDQFYAYVIAGVCLLFCGVFLAIVLFKRGVWNRLLLKITGIRLYKKIIRTLSVYSFRTLSAAFGLGISRYVVFGFQYILLLALFVPEMSFIQCVVGITITYVCASFVPSSILGELGVRGSVAVYMFGLFGAVPMSVFQVTLYLWLINMAVPVFVGSVLLFVYKISSRFEQEN